VFLENAAQALHFTSGMRAYRRGLLSIAGIAIVLALGVGYWLGVDRRDGGNLNAAVEARESRGPARVPQWQPAREKVKAVFVDDKQREVHLSRAQVWNHPAVPIEQANLGADPRDPREIVCRFHVSELGGTTPKFDCDLESGEQVRVKYGRTGELQGEVAATRLLRALGFGADYVTFLERLRCYGCPEEPFSTMKAVEITQAEKLYRDLMLSYDSFEDFEWVTMERRYEGRPIETKRAAGFGMFELDKVSSTKGGASRAEVDALRLMAVFLAHWDSKPDNQRIVCRSPLGWDGNGQCQQPFLLIQDLGATFGPHKVNLDNWQDASIWDDRTQCLTSMRDLPYDGATFTQVRISEAGRQFLGKMLSRLSDRQLTELFRAARFDKPHGLFEGHSTVAEWVAVFKSKVRQIAEGPPCATT